MLQHASSTPCMHACAVDHRSPQSGCAAQVRASLTGRQSACACASLAPGRRRLRPRTPRTARCCARPGRPHGWPPPALPAPSKAAAYRRASFYGQEAPGGAPGQAPRGPGSEHLPEAGSAQGALGVDLQSHVQPGSRARAQRDCGQGALAQHRLDVQIISAPAYVLGSSRGILSALLISEALCAHQGTAPRRSIGGQRAVSRIVRDIMCCAVVISDVERLAATVELLLHSCTCCMCCFLLQTGNLYRLEALDLRVRGLLRDDVVRDNSCPASAQRRPSIIFSEPLDCVIITQTCTTSHAPGVSLVRTQTVRGIWQLLSNLQFSL